MNTIDLLMKMDAGTITKVPTGEMEIKRLTELIGEKFVVKYKALNGRRITELSQTTLDGNGNLVGGKAYDGNLILIGEAMISPDLKDKDLQKHFGAASPKDLADKLFNGGEVRKIAGEIMQLSGYGNNTDEEIKN